MLMVTGRFNCGELTIASPVPNSGQRAHISRVLESVNWNKKQAASVLEISRGTLYRKIVEYGLEEAPPPSRNRTNRTET